MNFRNGTSAGPAHATIGWRSIRDGAGAGMAPLLSRDEAARATRYHHPDDAARFATGRAIARQALARATGCPAREVTLAIDANGKPHAADGPDFSISHSGDFVLLALADAGKIGADVEAMSGIDDWQACARLVFTPAECAAIAAAADPLATFYRQWTAKEAVSKAAGCGLLQDPLSYSLAWRGDRAKLAADGIAAMAGSWDIRPLACPPGYAAALACFRPA